MVLSDEQTLAQLMAAFPRRGILRWIGLRPQPRALLESVTTATLLTDRGLDGDHRAHRAGGKRQITLIQQEHLAVVEALCGISVSPGQLRRNLVVSGINLLALKDRRFRIGDALLEGNGLCHPCSRMEENLGPGGYNAMRGHGGITARVLEGATIELDQSVSVSD
ncbi:MAG: MOSC domain-containing protein [Gammaproteobacteria bacterium]|nr:MOSC domain-containing protein [Gammaproteobacteria bacterium]